MMPVNRKWASIVLAGAAGIGVLLYFQRELLTAPLRNLGGRPGASGPQSSKQKIVFKEDVDGSIANSDGFTIDLRGFVSSDGNEVSYSVSSPVASASVTAEFGRRLATADYVVVREPFRNAEGGVVGERAVIFFQGSRTHHEVAAVLWTYGRNLHSIESGSLYHALEFEKQIHR